MHIENGIVTDERPGQVKVESSPEAWCKACAARKSCMVGQEGAKRKRIIWMENSLGAHKGDLVSYSIEEKGVVAASVLLYFFPVCMLVAGAIAGNEYSQVFSMDKDLAAAAGGLLALVVAFFIIWVLSFYTRKHRLFRPCLLRIISETECSMLNDMDSSADH